MNDMVLALVAGIWLAPLVWFAVLLFHYARTRPDVGREQAHPAGAAPRLSAVAPVPVPLDDISSVRGREHNPHRRR